MITMVYDSDNSYQSSFILAKANILIPSLQKLEDAKKEQDKKLGTLESLLKQKSEDLENICADISAVYETNEQSIAEQQNLLGELKTTQDKAVLLTNQEMSNKVDLQL